VVLATFYHFPENSFIGLGIVLLGIPAYWLFKRRQVGK
jgi:LPXTG-motif cell wall-anchored protein